MSTKNNTMAPATSQLTEKLDNHGDQLTQLHNRVSDLVDELVVVRQELNKFKKNVAEDVKYLTTALTA